MCAYVVCFPWGGQTCDRSCVAPDEMDKMRHFSELLAFASQEKAEKQRPGPSIGRTNSDVSFPR